MSNNIHVHVNSGNGNFKVKVGLAEMLKGGAIMDVTNAEQASLLYRVLIRNMSRLCRYWVLVHS